MSNAKRKFVTRRLEKWIQPDTFSRSFSELREYLDGIEKERAEYERLKQKFGDK